MLAKEDQKEEKKQFNIYLPPSLIRAVKIAAIEDGLPLSNFVEEAIRLHLAQREREEQTS